MEHIQLISPFGRTSDGRDYNFVSNGGRNRWNIPKPKIGEFYASYCDHLAETMDEYEQPDPSPDNRNLAICSIMERAMPEMPIVIDMTLRFSKDPEDPYDSEFVKEVVSHMQHCIYEKYNLDEYDDDPGNLLICVITEPKKGYMTVEGKNRYYTYPVRFYFPFCKVEARTIDGLLESLSNQLRSRNVLGVLGQAPIGDWDSILKAYINTPLPLYGSSERAEQPPFYLEAIYPDLTDHINSDDSMSSVVSLTVGDVFDMNEHTLVLTNQVQDHVYSDLDDDELLPFFLSINFTPSTIPMREHDTPAATPIQRGSIADYGNRHYKSDKEMSVELLNLISPDRYLNKYRWIDIGKAIHTSFKGSAEGLSYWITNTDRAIARVRHTIPHLQPSVQEACSEAYYDFPEPTNVTVRTLAWFAREDNEESYKTWHNAWALPFRQESLNMSHDTLAKALYCELWLDHACHVQGKTRTVYTYENNRWVKVEDGYSIRMRISDDFKNAYEFERAELGEQIARTSDVREKARMEETHGVLSKIIKMLGNRGVRNQILGDVLDRLTIRSFAGLLDKNGSLTGHPNGVTEVDIDDAYIDFRRGKPEDYLSKTTAAKYDVNMSWEHKRVQDFMEWMKEMFIDNDTRHFVMKLFASGYVAGNYDKIGPFFTGDFNNGKSTLSNFIIRAWGAYAVKFPTTGITRGYSDSGSPNPAMVRISGPRWGLADEPDAKEKFHSGPFKRVFGNDDFYNRGLYSDGGDLENTCTVTVWANRIPPFPDADAACRIRFCCIPCLTTYVKEGAPESREEQFAQRIMPMRKSFQTSVNRLTSAALWVWHQYFPIWCKESLDYRPPEIEAATTAYWEENDIYLMYKSDRIEVTGSTDDSVNVTQVYKDFEVWFNMFNKGDQVPPRPTVRYHLIQHWGKLQGGKWYGIKIKDTIEDVEFTALSNTGSSIPGNAPSNIPSTIKASKSNKKVPRVNPELMSKINMNPAVTEGPPSDIGNDPVLSTMPAIPQKPISASRVELVGGKLVNKIINNDDEDIHLSTLSHSHGIHNLLGDNSVIDAI